MDWTDISITCVCIKHSFSLPSNEFTVKCVGRVTVAEKKLCDVECTFLSKKLSLPLGKLIFSPLFSQLHTFLLWWVLGCGFSVVVVLGIPTPLPKKNKLLFANVLKVSFLSSTKKNPVMNLSRHGTYFSAVQHPCSVSFLTFVKCSENDSCTDADLHSFPLFSWPPGPQYGHQRSSLHMRGVWKQAGLALSKEIIKREWEPINFLPSPPTSLFQRHSKNNLYVEWTEVFLLQKPSSFHMDYCKGFLDICPISTFWPARKQASDSVFVWLPVLQSSGSAFLAICICNFSSDQLFRTFIQAHRGQRKKYSNPHIWFFELILFSDCFSSVYSA